MYIEGMNEEISAASGQQQQSDGESIDLTSMGFKVKRGHAAVSEDYDEDEGGA